MAGTSHTLGWDLGAHMGRLENISLIKFRFVSSRYGCQFAIRREALGAIAARRGS